ncbi:MAG: hypothetical protein E3J37_05340 [Anaerolineales bacterium]|nr:MAG: hypothetical protein E3J37_05340 [Anaerolineales bacterium]
MYQGGYTGRTAWIDLTKKTASIEPTDHELTRLFMGGAGFGVKLLYDLVQPGTDPLSPGNVLVFAPGPLTGTSAPCSSRITVTGRSPLTGAVGMATSGGQFPAEMKFSGFDIIVVQGQATDPVYLVIENGEIRFRSAKKIWGANTTDCQLFIKQELRNHNFRVACIGQAGERQSLTACIINERRAMGRKGLGAVMGAKRLKAIAVRGDCELAIAEPQRFQAERQQLLARFKAHPALYSEFSRYGTSSLIDLTSEMGIFPARNYADTGKFTPIEQIGYQAQAKDIIHNNPCHTCPVACSQVRIARSGEYQGTLTEGPEFETSWAFGGATGVTDLSAIYLADRLCDEYGLDTITVGATIAFAMELFERDILTIDETDGLELRFGNHKAMIEMIHRIARRQGFGEVLADGALRASQQIGRGSERYVMHIKGLELPGYDVRAAKAQGLNYATAFTGGDHNRGYAFQEIYGVPVPIQVDRCDPEGKPELTMWNQVMEAALCDCPTFCSFMISDGLLRDTEQGMSKELSEQRVGTVSEMVSAATAIEFSPSELILLGERVNTLARCFNLREGFSRKDDYLPVRLSEEPIPAGPSEGYLTSREEQDGLLDQYYEVYGYDQRGVPTRERLRRLSLESVADDLEALGLGLE